MILLSLDALCLYARPPTLSVLGLSFPVKELTLDREGWHRATTYLEAVPEVTGTVVSALRRPSVVKGKLSFGGRQVEVEVVFTELSLIPFPEPLPEPRAFVTLLVRGSGL